MYQAHLHRLEQTMQPSNVQAVALGKWANGQPLPNVPETAFMYGLDVPGGSSAAMSIIG